MAFLLAAVVTIPLWIQLGGPSGNARVQSHENCPDTRIGVVPLTATIVGPASMLSRFRMNEESSRRLFKTVLRLAIFGLSAYFAFSWGARDAPVFGLLIVLTGRLYLSLIHI